MVAFIARKIFGRSSAVQPAIQIMPTDGREKSTDSREVQATTDKPALVMTTVTYNPSKYDIFFLGITIVIGGQYFCWNAGTAAGLYSFLIAYFLIASAYITFCCCTAEVTGALPFAGGSYGLARCTLGFYPAFMIGCSEALEYIAYVSASTISFSELIMDSAPSLKHIAPLLWALFYVSALFIHIKGGQVFWRFNICIGITSLFILVLYCIGSLPFANFAKYAMDPELQFVDGFHGFMKSLPLAAWFFVGVEALNLSSDQVDEPKKVIPVAQVSCVATLFLTGLSVLLVTVSLPPGLRSLPTQLVPFDSGFALLFNIRWHEATILSLPATYATAFGFIWCYGKLIVAMSNSHLMPYVLARTTKGNQTPYAALLAGSIVSYIICIIAYYVPVVGANLFRICILSAFMSYTGQCIGYISLKRNYRNIKSSEFRSPWGIYGALYSMSVWVLAIVAVFGFQDHGNTELIVYSIFMLILTLVYFGYARKRQTFSAQENRVMLVAHVTKFNVKKVAAGRRQQQQKSNDSRQTGPRTESVTDNGKRKGSRPT